MNEKKDTCCYSVFDVPHTLPGFFLYYYYFFFPYGGLNHDQIHWMSLKDHNNNGDQISTIDWSWNLRYFWKTRELDLLLWTFYGPLNQGPNHSASVGCAQVKWRNLTSSFSSPVFSISFKYSMPLNHNPNRTSHLKC